MSIYTKALKWAKRNKEMVDVLGWILRTITTTYILKTHL